MTEIGVRDNPVCVDEVDVSQYTDLASDPAAITVSALYLWLESSNNKDTCSHSLNNKDNALPVHVCSACGFGSYYYMYISEW